MTWRKHSEMVVAPYGDRSESGSGSGSEDEDESDVDEL